MTAEEWWKEEVAQSVNRVQIKSGMVHAAKWRYLKTKEFAKFGESRNRESLLFHQRLPGTRNTVFKKLLKKIISPAAPLLSSDPHDRHIMTTWRS
eukprot:scaffold22177_cov90-Skeletonema_dohrnii-CCMP3373.AAC.3